MCGAGHGCQSGLAGWLLDGNGAADAAGEGCRRELGPGQPPPSSPQQPYFICVERMSGSGLAASISMLHGHSEQVQAGPAGMVLG